MFRNSAGTATVLGRVGLLLRGMILMIDGLKLAAGQARRPTLGRWTSTPMRALVPDALITAVLHSYSAVAVALMRPLTRPVLRFLNALSCGRGGRSGGGDAHRRTLGSRLLGAWFPSLLWPASPAACAGWWNGPPKEPAACTHWQPSRPGSRHRRLCRCRVERSGFRIMPSIHAQSPIRAAHTAR